jgi:hypothetical protein
MLARSSVIEIASADCSTAWRKIWAGKASPVAAGVFGAGLDMVAPFLDDKWGLLDD